MHRSIKQSGSVVSEGMSGMNYFYSHYLGTPIMSITPASLELAVDQIRLFVGHINNAQVIDLIDVGQVVDIAKPITVTALELEPGFYYFLRFSFSLTGLSDGVNSITSRISFPKPDGFNFDTHVYSTTGLGDLYNITAEGNNIKSDLLMFTPGAVVQHSYVFFNYTLSVDHFMVPHNLHGIYVVGDTYKAINIHPARNVTYNEIWPGFNSDEIFLASGFHIVTPFEGINTAKIAGDSVRLDIVWDMQDIIEVYEGITSSPNDYIFVLRNGWWNNFSVTVATSDAQWNVFISGDVNAFVQTLSDEMKEKFAACFVSCNGCSINENNSCLCRDVMINGVVHKNVCYKNLVYTIENPTTEQLRWIEEFIIARRKYIECKNKQTTESGTKPRRTRNLY